jgi:microcystin-dependent protein
MEQIYSTVGGRPVLTDDLLLLQTELDQSAKAFLQNRNAMILSGCTVSGTGPSSYNISSGIILCDNQFLKFDGVTGIAFPYYLKQDTVTLSNYKAYEVGGSKATRQILKAIGTSTLPVSGEYITMSTAGGRKMSNAFDTEFVLTAGTQTVAGNKTHSGNNTYSGASSFTGTTNFTNTVSLNATVNTNITSTGVIQGSRYVSTIGTGTQPLTVNSTTVVSNLNADMVDGYHASTFFSADAVLQSNINALSSTVSSLNVVISGIIVMWSGSVGSIPSGYYLCNGANGTPDLRDRFIIGAGNSYSAGNTGGAANKTLSIAEMPNHSHTVFSAGSHQHYVKEVDAGEEGNAGTDQSVGNYTDTGTTKYTSFAGDHTHSLSYTGSSTAFSILPPYYALAFIMKA